MAHTLDVQRVPTVIAVTGHRDLRPVDEPILENANRRHFRRAARTRSDFGVAGESGLDPIVGIDELSGNYVFRVDNAGDIYYSGILQNSAVARPGMVTTGYTTRSTAPNVENVGTGNLAAGTASIRFEQRISTCDRSACKVPGVLNPRWGHEGIVRVGKSADRVYRARGAGWPRQRVVRLPHRGAGARPLERTLATRRGHGTRAVAPEDAQDEVLPPEDHPHAVSVAETISLPRRVHGNAERAIRCGRGRGRRRRCGDRLRRRCGRRRASRPSRAAA